MYIDGCYLPHLHYTDNHNFNAYKCMLHVWSNAVLKSMYIFINKKYSMFALYRIMLKKNKKLIEKKINFVDYKTKLIFLHHNMVDVEV